MRIEHLTVTEIGRPLAEPARNALQAWHARAGIVLELVDELGNVGQGEASPLPGYSPDDLATNRAALGGLRLGGLELDPTLPVARLFGAVGEHVPPGARAARFALETALLDLVARRRQIPAWSLLAEGTPLPVPLSALLDAPSLEQRWAQAKRARDRGVATFKVKLGRHPGELDDLSELRDRLGSGARIRLDANQGWTPEEAMHRLPSLPALAPEFLEEPVRGFELGHRSPAAEPWDRSPIPLALDESLQPWGVADTLRHCPVPRAARVLVLKPTVLGGLSRCLELAQLGRELGLELVVSHAFEGPIAWAAAASLALAVQSGGLAAGLDRHPGLSAWPQRTPATVGRGELVPAPCPGLGVERVEGT